MYVSPKVFEADKKKWHTYESLDQGLSIQALKLASNHTQLEHNKEFQKHISYWNVNIPSKK